MTTKKELRDALRRYVRIADRYANRNAELTTEPWTAADAQEYRDSVEAARAILARPARVVGYRVRLNGAIVHDCMVDAYAEGWAQRNAEEKAEACRSTSSGHCVVRKLVVR